MKKMIALLTVFALLIGVFQMPGGVMAREEPKITLKQAIEIAKTTLSLQTDGFEFNSSYIENQNGFNIWSLNWNNTKTNNESINVSIDSNMGEIVSLSWYTPYEQPKSRIPKYTRAEALKAAETWMTKLQSDKFKLTKLKDNPNQDYYNKYSDVYAFEFVRMQDGIEVTPNIISVQLDKNTLKIRNFYMVWDNQELPAKANAISLDQAKEVFKNKLGLELTYNFIYGNTNNEPKAILAYTLKNGNSPIDAISSELLNNMYRIYYGMDRGSTSAKAEAAVPMTPQEQSVLDDQSKYISKEAAEQAIRQYVKIDNTMKLERANLYQGYNKANATWNLEWKYSGTENKSYKYINAQIDAVTKELKSLYINDNNEDQVIGETTIGKEAAKKLAEEFLVKVQPDKFKNTLYKEAKDSYGIMPVYKNDFSFNYIRVENGIPTPTNSLFVSINEYTGEVISYNANWLDIEFPTPDKAITLDKAYEALFSEVKFGMEYTYHYPNENDYDKKEIKLAYTLENTNILMDANNGIMLNYDGTPVKSAKKLAYTDIKGNKAEDDINTLIDMGILVPEGNTFAPESNMLQKDFLKLLVSSLQEYYPMPVAKTEDQYDNLYNEAIRRKLINTNEKNPESVVTRQDAARMIVRAMNYGVLAEKGNMFAVSFKDASSIPAAFKGYAVIASELGIIPAVDSYFYPNKSITNGDAAEIIVNYLKVETSL
ncbi:MAG: hypothetical protein A2Y23_04575 [Clostridiales bacterium GWB2_37_7]|nr:MAG: hypothetical protein A2Y23_04575 [Clostridiales bacterium GWB2_37_7]